MRLGPPTQAGFLNFVRNAMGIPAPVLPDDSLTITIAFTVAMDLVNEDILQVSQDMYTLAVYNLAGSDVVAYAPDNPALPAPANTFFQDLRTLYNITKFAAGVVSSAADVSTSATLEVIEATKNFTLANLQQLKDPWGRRYLSIAQAYGPTIWGLTA